MYGNAGHGLEDSGSWVPVQACGQGGGGATGVIRRPEEFAHLGMSLAVQVSPPANESFLFCF